MSLKNYAFKKYLRLHLRKRLKEGLDVEVARNDLATAIKTFMPKLSSKVRLQQTRVEAVAGEWVEREGVDKDRLIIYFHGGGFTVGSPASHRGVTTALAAALKAKLFCIDYRRAPECRYPAAHEDCFTVYKHFAQSDQDFSKVVVAGDQVGVALLLSTLLKAREEKLKLPAAMVCFSPLVDMSLSGQSMQKNLKKDDVLTPEGLEFSIAHYLESHEERITPAISPVFVDLKGLPPAFIQVGEDEILLDDALRLEEALVKAGSDVVLELWKSVPHMWQLVAFSGSMGLPEGKKAIKQIGRLIEPILNTRVKGG
jgi:acetyl esterase/lipase